MEGYIQQYVGLVDGVKLTLLMVLIFANFLTGLAVSIKTATFRLKELGLMLRDRILPYVLGYLAVGVVGLVDQAWQVAVPVVWGIILLTLVGAILQNLKELGINLPDSLGGGNQ
jgi:phage-related holin